MPTHSRPMIAIAAQSFGFGPASKAVAVARAAQTRGLDVLAFGNGVAYEFFHRNGLSLAGDCVLDPSNPANRSVIETKLASCSLGLVSLDPDWAGLFARRLPTFFIDSLGFMWNQRYFDEHPVLRGLAGYLCQDVFGAANRVRSRGLRNVHAVGAIIDVGNADHVRPKPTAATSIVIHLGGMFNSFSPDPVGEYAAAIGTLLSGCVRPDQALLLTSDLARATFPQPAWMTGEFRTHPDAIALYDSAHRIVGSPGLTTLLELAALGRGLVPLPPQNLSQALILHNMVTTVSGLPRIWRFLADHYQLPPEIAEEDGVRRVNALNRALLAGSEFNGIYRALFAEAIAAPEKDLVGLVSDFEGAEACLDIALGRMSSGRAIRAVNAPTSLRTY